MIHDEEHHDNRYEDEPEPSTRPADEDKCGGRNTLTRFADGDLCAPDVRPSDFDVGLGEIDAGGEEVQW